MGGCPGWMDEDFNQYVNIVVVHVLLLNNNNIPTVICFVTLFRVYTRFFVYISVPFVSTSKLNECCYRHGIHQINDRADVSALWFPVFWHQVRELLYYQWPPDSCIWTFCSVLNSFNQLNWTGFHGNFNNQHLLWYCLIMGAFFIVWISPVVTEECF
jgi:hypothetical protein